MGIYVPDNLMYTPTLFYSKDCISLRLKYTLWHHEVDVGTKKTMPGIPIINCLVLMIFRKIGHNCFCPVVTGCTQAPLLRHIFTEDLIASVMGDVTKK